MPLEIPGFVYDPETNRYYKQASRSQESSNSQKVIQRITVSKAAKKRRTQREKKDQEKRWGRHKGKGNKVRTSSLPFHLRSFVHQSGICHFRFRKNEPIHRLSLSLSRLWIHLKATLELQNGGKYHRN